ncbi:hypothetical protein MMC12_001297 [Toensbergia leucococca]|nr:hypothetical protein [Toensbergia leucococca]
MDPLSLAGLGLGATSLAFQLFAGCIQGFVWLSTAHNLGRDSTTLICMLNLQEIKLTDWAQRAGLLGEERTLDRRLNEKVIEALLKELHDLLLDTDKLKSRYKLDLIAGPDAGSGEMRHVSPRVSRGILSHAISNELRGEVLQRANLIQSKNSFPRRLWWAAVDKSKFEDLIERIGFFVGELWELLDLRSRDNMSRRLETILSHVINMSEKMEELSSLRETLQLDSPATCSLTIQSRCLSLASAADIKAVGLNIRAYDFVDSTEDETTIFPSQGLSKQHVADLDKANLKDFIPMKSDCDMGLARYKEAIVFVEWKAVPVQSRTKIVERAKNLAVLLNAPKHPDFRSLHCKGIARDNNAAKIAFVYDWPAQNTAQPPLTLRSLFKITPSVTTRLQLALQLIRTLKCFHTAGWLHKNLRSEYILFFNHPDAGNQAPLLNPILAGFAFSRLNSPSEISEQPSSDPQRDIYRHPEAMGEPSVSFTAAKDVYALGIMLVEIGEWRSLRSLVEKVVDVSKANVPTNRLEKVRPFLLDDGPKGGLGMLKYRMGDVYVAVAKMMLSGKIPQSWDYTRDSGLIFRPDLLDVAIRELGRCII